MEIAIWSLVKLKSPSERRSCYTYSLRAQTRRSPRPHGNDSHHAPHSLVEILCKSVSALFRHYSVPNAIRSVCAKNRHQTCRRTASMRCCNPAGCEKNLEGDHNTNDTISVIKATGGIVTEHFGRECHPREVHVQRVPRHTHFARAAARSALLSKL
jgi:hypothetical protein